MGSVSARPFPIALPVAGFRFWSLLYLLVLPLPVQALEVQIEAPPELETLLMAHLEIARAARAKEALPAEERDRLLRVSDETAHELLATEGYFSPRIETAINGENTSSIIHYRVTPGPRTQVIKVSIRYAGALAGAGKDAARLRARIEGEWPLKQGMPFRQADWDRAKNGVLLPLFGAAYAAARIADSAVEVDPEAHTAEVSLLIDSGPVFLYGPIVIEGSRRYPQEIARNLAPMRPGKPYRQQDLLDYQSVLEASGYYAQALVTIDPDPAIAAAVPVRVSVVEKPKKRLSFGLGASTDTGARVQVEGLHQDILHQGLRLKIGTKLETKQQQGVVEWAWPRGERGFQDSLGLQLKRTDIAGQVTESLLFGGKRARTRGTVETSTGLQYQVEQQKLGSALAYHNRALSANYSWAKRTEGRGAFPVSGYVLNWQAGGAAAALLSDRSFVRLYGRHTQYFRLGERGRLILRGELGGVLADSRDGIPTDFLFRAGGDNSVRGYAYQSLGRIVAGAVEPVRLLATASIEANYFFTHSWGVALFVDAGDAADQVADLAPKFGYGLGARWRSPLGPLNLDVAYGEATHQYRLHFSLGVSF